jgi:hypothetical protein
VVAAAPRAVVVAEVAEVAEAVLAAVAAVAAVAGGDAMISSPLTFRTDMTTATMIRTIATAFALAGLVLMFPVADALAADATPKPSVASKIVQTTFATPEDAGRSLSEAMKSGDWKRIYAVLGPGSGTLIYTGDKVEDAATRDLFVAAYDKSAKFDRDGDARATLLIGENDYPFPFPLVKGAKGWNFDARAGAEEIVNRRIGENELDAIQVCLAYVDAQREYATKDRNSNGLLEYATKLVSTPGKQDGLYWPTKEGEPPSPFGPLATRAAGEGYGMDASGVPRAYHGYHYRILIGQGSSAQGGAYDYRVRGKMIGGFAMVAFPARWGVSGVMSFICNHDGVVYEKNLGSETPASAKAMTRFDPDSTWNKVPQ